MQNLRRTVVALSVLLAGIGCSDNPTQREITDETIRLNKTLIDQGAVNPKTQYLKHKEEVKVASTTHTVDISHENDIKIAKLISERDAAINANLEMEKIIANYKSQSENQSDLQKKINLTTKELETFKQLTAEKEAQIANLIKERDDAIKVTLEMKKASEEFESQKSEWDTKMQSLMQTEKEQESSWKEKIAASAAALLAAQQLTADKNEEIEKLIKERDDAIKVTLEMKKANEEFEGKLSQNETELNEKLKALQLSKDEADRLAQERQDELDRLTNELSHLKDNFSRELQEKQNDIDELSKLKQEQGQAEEGLQEKLNTCEQLAADKQTEIENLIKERDDAIKVTLEMKKASEEFESQKSEWDTKMQSLMQTEKEQESSWKEKVAASAAALLAAQQLTADKDADIESLKKERDDAIKVTLEMKKANEEFEAEKSALNEKIEKLSTELAEIQKSYAEKDADIQRLTKEKDEISQKISSLEEADKNCKLQLEELEQLKEKISTLNTSLLEAQKLSETRQADIDKLTKQRDDALKTSTQIRKKLEAEEQNAKKAVIDTIVNTFKLSKVEFKTGSAILTEKSKQLLDKVAEIMKAHSDYHYKIQGHTDSQGKAESNLALSKNRAQSVKDYLISKSVSEGILSSEGLGSSVPIADNKTKEGRLQNRRVVFEIVN